MRGIGETTECFVVAEVTFTGGVPGVPEYCLASRVLWLYPYVSVSDQGSADIFSDIYQSIHSKPISVVHYCLPHIKMPSGPDLVQIIDCTTKVGQMLPPPQTDAPLRQMPLAKRVSEVL